MIWPTGYFSSGQTVLKKAKFDKFGRKKAKLATLERGLGFVVLTPSCLNVSLRTCEKNIYSIL